MAFVAAVLGDGQLPNSKTALFTSPGATTTYVKKLSLFNDNAAQQLVIIYLNVSGTSRKWRRYILNQNESAEVLENGESVILEDGDSIEAVTTTASAVDYVLTGVEEA